MVGPESLDAQVQVQDGNIPPPTFQGSPLVSEAALEGGLGITEESVESAGSYRPHVSEEKVPSVEEVQREILYLDKSIQKKEQREEKELESYHKIKSRHHQIAAKSNRMRKQLEEEKLRKRNTLVIDAEAVGIVEAVDVVEGVYVETVVEIVDVEAQAELEKVMVAQLEEFIATKEHAENEFWQKAYLNKHIGEIEVENLERLQEVAKLKLKILEKIETEQDKSRVWKKLGVWKNKVEKINTCQNQQQIRFNNIIKIQDEVREVLKKLVDARIELTQLANTKLKIISKIKDQAEIEKAKKQLQEIEARQLTAQSALKDLQEIERKAQQKAEQQLKEQKIIRERIVELWEQTEIEEKQAKKQLLDDLQEIEAKQGKTKFRYIFSTGPYQKCLIVSAVIIGAISFDYIMMRRLNATDKTQSNNKKQKISANKKHISAKERLKLGIRHYFIGGTLAGGVTYLVILLWNNYSYFLG